MTREELEKILSAKSEDEVLEFKEAKNQFSVLGKTEKGKDNKKSLYGYAAAIGNEGGGKLILGVKDKINPKTGMRDVVGTEAIQNIKKVKEEIYQMIGRKIDIIEFYYEDKKVQIVEIPARPFADVFKFYGIALERNGENLVEMKKERLREILNENQPDYSAEICENASLADLDKAAIGKLKEKWAEKSGKKEYLKLKDEELLEKLLLKSGAKITNAAIILLGNEQALARNFANSEFIIEWRSKEKLDADFRKNIRKPFVLAFDETWEIVNARNIRTPFRQGFIELDIWAYDEDSIREAVLNAFAHREYFNRTEPVFIKFTPDNFKIKSPGGFVSGVNADNALFVEGKWRNRLIMETLEKVGLVERAGVGLDRIFKKTIKDGKGLPYFEDGDDVILNIPAKIKDLNFVYFLEKIAKEKQISIDHIRDFVELESIREKGESSDKERVNNFFKNGIIEKIGKTRGIKYILAKEFYEFIDERSEYTRKKWLSKEQQKQVLYTFFKQHKKGRMRDFNELFENKLKKYQINRLLSELKDENIIILDGNPKSIKSHWRIKETD
jgi:ATP-dependent DNA helicase RecG